MRSITCRLSDTSQRMSFSMKEQVWGKERAEGVRIKPNKSTDNQCWKVKWKINKNDLRMAIFIRRQSVIEVKKQHSPVRNCLILAVMNSNTFTVLSGSRQTLKSIPPFWLKIWWMRSHSWTLHRTRTRSSSPSVGTSGCEGFPLTTFTHKHTGWELVWRAPLCGRRCYAKAETMVTRRQGRDWNWTPSRPPLPSK